MRASLEVWGGRIHCAPFRIVGVIARDATEIEAREKPAKKETNDKNDDPPPPDSAAPRKRGRPRKDEQRPKPEPTRLERQTMKLIHMPDPDDIIFCTGSDKRLLRFAKIRRGGLPPLNTFSTCRAEAKHASLFRSTLLS
jgi:hypothetical protein